MAVHLDRLNGRRRQSDAVFTRCSV
jgi:hypothetical protein